jgi:hypothetical protein
MSFPAETRGTVSVPGWVFLELLCVTVRLGECHSVLAEVVALTGEAPGLSDEQVRAVLVALGDRAARLLEGETR